MFKSSQINIYWNFVCTQSFLQKVLSDFVAINHPSKLLMCPISLTAHILFSTQTIVVWFIHFSSGSGETAQKLRALLGAFAENPSLIPCNYTAGDNCL